MRTSDMKKFVLKVTLFALCIVLVDCLCGIFFPILQSHLKGGSTRTNYYLSDECDADILVLGSSRAMHHYVPRVLDSLGGTAYNAGNDGMGILLGYGRYLMCAEKYIPRIVILDVGAFDYVKDDNSKYLKFLRPYGDRGPIRNIIAQIGEPFVNFKMLSNMYRNSSRIIPNIRDLFANEDLDNRGYFPLYKTCQNCGNVKHKQDEVGLELDTVKLNVFDQFVQDVFRRGSKLYFVISPMYTTEKMDVLPVKYAYAEVLSKKYNVPLLNNIFISGISDNPAMFSDWTHVNDVGAKAFSRKIVKDIMNLQNGW